MNVIDVLKYSAGSLKTQKGRAGLTILGVVIGITAIVALNSLTAGFQNTLTGQLEQGLSAKSLTLTSGSSFFTFGGEGSTLPPAKFYMNQTAGLEAIPHVDYAIGTLKLPTGAVFTYQGNDGLNRSATFSCVNFTSYQQAFTAFSTVGGAGSIPVGNDSIVVGYSIYDPYSNGTHLVTLGANITLIWSTNLGVNLTVTKTHDIHVSGVLGKIGGFSIGGGPVDRGIYIPVELGSEIFNTEEISSFTIVIDSSDQAIIDQVTADIEEYYSGSAVSISSPTAILGTLSTVFDTMSIFITAIAAISLIVAGIGIMNIMTVSIIERTREIGILKALGAKDRDILGVFLFESFLIGLIGSMIGIGLGYLGSLALGFLISGFQGGGLMGGSGGFGLAVTPVLTFDLIWLSLAFGIGVAVFFAVSPAVKAARKAPVEALRAE
nr:ABC transporter permease [Candidatus Sigynarchaeota archaeon]